MAGENSRRKRPSSPSVSQLMHDLRSLQSSHEQLKATVGKLKDILQVHDNWHSNIAPWINKRVDVRTTDGEYTGKLLWTDRYNIGIEIGGEKVLFNKGHVIRIKLA